jgi:acyl carrier protein phosphodiesterase
MNFLAHFHLAWPDAGLVAGGLEDNFFSQYEALQAG